MLKNISNIKKIEMKNKLLKLKSIFQKIAVGFDKSINYLDEKARVWGLPTMGLIIIIFIVKNERF